MENRKVELNDDALDAVSGGVLYEGIDWAVGTKVCASVCSCCGRNDAIGTITVVNRPKRGGVIRVDVAMDCCGSVGCYTLGDGIRQA